MYIVFNAAFSYDFVFVNLIMVLYFSLPDYLIKKECGLMTNYEKLDNGIWDGDKDTSHVFNFNKCNTIRTCICFKRGAM